MGRIWKVIGIAGLTLSLSGCFGEAFRKNNSVKLVHGTECINNINLEEYPKKPEIGEDTLLLSGRLWLAVKSLTDKYNLLYNCLKAEKMT